MTWLFYAGFCDSTEGARIARELADEGVAETDVALIIESAGKISGKGKLAVIVRNQARIKPGVTVATTLGAVLRDYGMSAGLCDSLARCVASGGSVLILSEKTGPVPITKLESLLRECTPMVAGTFVTVQSSVCSLV